MSPAFVIHMRHLQQAGAKVARIEQDITTATATLPEAWRESALKRLEEQWEAAAMELRIAAKLVCESFPSQNDEGAQS